MRNAIRAGLAALALGLTATASAQPGGVPLPERECQRECLEGFVDRYFALLSAGGTKHYDELLAPFGLNARDPSFWQIGLSMTAAQTAAREPDLSWVIRYRSTVATSELTRAMPSPATVSRK